MVVNVFTNGTRRSLAAIAALILACPITASRAELVYFAKGGQAQVAATVEGERVIVNTPAGEFEFLKSDFKSIVPGNWPAREWESRKAAALAGNAQARFEAAWWALENGLTPEAEVTLRAAGAADPKDAIVSRMLATLDALSRPCADSDVARLQHALGDNVQIERGPHVLLLHQHTAEEAAERVGVLERVIRTYYLILAAQGLDLNVPKTRMASAWFKEHHDYRSFLRAEHADAFLGTRGYYHPTLRAVVAYDSRSAGAEKSGREAINARLREVERLAATVDRMPPEARPRISFPGEPARTMSRDEAKAFVGLLRRDVSRQRVLWELQWRALDLGTASHEMVHQLMAASGLPARHAEFPMWLHEGFAAQFEVIRGGEWAGVGRAHDLRLNDWRQIKTIRRLPGLIRDEGFGRGYKRDLYASCWAFVYYLRKRHPQEFVSYLQLLGNPHVGDPSARGRSVETFRTVFGDSLDDLESDWRHFMDGVATPLESHSPHPGPVAGAPKAQNN